MEELNRFIKYMNQLYADGYCVFYDMSGHVDWLDFSIRASKKDYKTSIYNGVIYLDMGKSVKEQVDDYIHGIQKVIADFGKSIQDVAKQAEEMEYTEYLRLHAKYASQPPTEEIE